MTMLRLAVRPEDYHGKVVSTVGYLARDAYGGFSLFVSQAYFVEYGGGGGVRLPTKTVESLFNRTDLARMQTGISSVQVVGRFDAYEGVQDFTIGFIAELMSAARL